MPFKLKLHIRIDDMSTMQIYRFDNENYTIISDVEANKLYRLKIVGGTLTQQEVTITDGALIEIGDPITYVKS